VLLSTVIKISFCNSESLNIFMTSIFLYVRHQKSQLFHETVFLCYVTWPRIANITAASSTQLPKHVVQSSTIWLTSISHLSLQLHCHIPIPDDMPLVSYNHRAAVQHNPHYSKMNPFDVTCWDSSVTVMTDTDLLLCFCLSASLLDQCYEDVAIYASRQHLLGRRRMSG